MPYCSARASDPSNFNATRKQNLGLCLHQIVLDGMNLSLEKQIHPFGASVWKVMENSSNFFLIDFQMRYIKMRCRREISFSMN